MFLYHVEISTTDEKNLVAVVIADSDDAAFKYAQTLAKRQFSPSQEIKESTIIEKKYLEKGRGYVFQTLE
ncbi:DUF3906 family protein [Brevibacillus daliensis]|uniref:DUF3906 family protein n=1 Tax=Brevibacillus daliensis TaxID=2892995 RepID=UPI001E39FB93|nr:DUF3906 family protein [Brevibacillus daliensis]